MCKAICPAFIQYREGWHKMIAWSKWTGCGIVCPRLVWLTIVHVLLISCYIHYKTMFKIFCRQWKLTTPRHFKVSHGHILYTVDGLIFVGYQFSWFSWRVQSTNSSTNKIANFCMNYEGKYTMTTNFEPHECVIFVQFTKIGSHENKAINSTYLCRPLCKLWYLPSPLQQWNHQLWLYPPVTMAPLLNIYCWLAGPYKINIIRPK